MDLAKKGSITALAICAVACNSVGYQSIATKTGAPVGTVITWSPDRMAAVIAPGPAGERHRVCMQAALAIKEKDIEGGAKISQAILAYSKVLESFSEKATSGDLVELSGKINETVILLSTTTERTTFLNSGLFYACQMAANQNLGPEETARMVSMVLQAVMLLDTAKKEPSKKTE